jgi:1,2-phenylacetyl-CoA epoxidase catalytic subunit
MGPPPTTTITMTMTAKMQNEMNHGRLIVDQDGRPPLE